MNEFEKRVLDAFDSQAQLELRYNPYHDPRNGRFTTAGGGGGGVLFVGKGQKGKGSYVYERDIDTEYEAFKSQKAIDLSKMNKSDLILERDKNQVKINTVKETMERIVSERDVTTSAMPDNYYQARNELTKLQDRNMKLNSEIAKRQAAEAAIEREKNPPSPKKFINSFGEATTRYITSSTYERAQKRLDKMVLRNMGY